MEVYRYQQFPSHLATVHVALFDNVTNADELHARLIRASTLTGSEGETEREAVNFAFIDARLIASIQHLKAAVYHAILAATQGGLKTKSVHSEIIWTLNPTNNITEALRRYGVSASSSSLFVVRVDRPLDGLVERLSTIVHGTLVPLDSLKDMTNWDTIKKHYKLNDEPAIRNAAGDKDVERRKIDRIVTSSVATKIVMG
ncbi:CGI-121-domain-containing protein [Irpex rosettiformis]|uniref:CGI-121-domain-containing protein n=1 Tax=Irpex rosettiformis TaxID=378272 RepID=A0ACB8TQH5_9APHY|nr:CGI-121-domain-containing protein [Irpex rosettiformis]